MSFAAAERATTQPDATTDRAANALRQLRQNVALLERLDNGLRQNEAKLHAQGTGFAIVNDVPVNQLFHSPL